MRDHPRLFDDDPTPETETAWRWAGREGARLHLVQSVLDEDGEVFCCIEDGQYVTVCGHGPWEASVLTYPPAPDIDVCARCWGWLTDEMLADIADPEEVTRP